MNKLDDKYIKKFQPKKISKYRECQECKKKFKLNAVQITVESKFENFKIFCPSCESVNIAVINRDVFYDQ